MAAVMPRRIPVAPVCLCVLCGLPAAGKSTLSRKILGTVAECGWRAAVVSYDDLIQEQAYYTQMEEEHSNWKSHRQAVLQCIEQFLERPEVFGEMPSSPLINGSAWQKCVSTLLQPEELNRDGTPLLLLLDDNFYYPSMRYEVYQLARKLFLGFCQVFLQCDLETCIRRNQSRPRPIPVKVIMEMEKRLESPNPQRNLWESQTILLDSTNDVTKCDIQRVIELISTALNNPLSPAEDNSEKKVRVCFSNEEKNKKLKVNDVKFFKIFILWILEEADRLKCAKSVVHQADQACRRLISEAMQAAREHQVPPGDMRVLAARLNECKGTFLHDLRKHFLQEVVFLQEEDISVEQLVQRALRRDFHDKKDEILLNIMRNQKT